MSAAGAGGEGAPAVQAGTGGDVPAAAGGAGGAGAVAAAAAAAAANLAGATGAAGAAEPDGAPASGSGVDEGAGAGGDTVAEEGSAGASRKRKAGETGEAGGTVCTLPQPKKPKSAYNLFKADKQRDLMAANPTFGMGDVSKAVSEMWKVISAEAKQAYMTLAAEAKREYEAEVALFTEQGGVLGASTGKHKGEDGKGEEAGELVLPVSRVVRIAKLDRDTKKVTKEAAGLLTKATELFLEFFCESAHRAAASSAKPRKPLDYRAIRECVIRGPEQLEFLDEDLPDVGGAPGAAPAPASGQAAADASPALSGAAAAGTSPRTLKKRVESLPSGAQAITAFFSAKTEPAERAAPLEVGPLAADALKTGADVHAPPVAVPTDAPSLIAA